MKSILNQCAYFLSLLNIKGWSTTECTYKQLDKIFSRTQNHMIRQRPQRWCGTFPHCFPKKRLKYQRELGTDFRRIIYIYTQGRIQSTGATSSWCPPFIQSSGSICYRPRPVRTTIRMTGIQRWHIHTSLSRRRRFVSFSLSDPSLSSLGVVVSA